MAAQLIDAIVEQFEIVDSARADVETGRLTAGITESVYGPLEQFHHPVASLLAVGMAGGLERLVSTETTAVSKDRVDYQVTLYWDEDT